jgi:sterol desaturase/sphingolipid hydroxylase (fatty acid hydroxylase superfamily)
LVSPKIALISEVVQPPAETLLAYKGAAVLVWLVLLFVLERLLPAAPRPDGAGMARLGRNATLVAANALLSRWFVIPLTAWAAAGILDWRPLWWTGWPGLLLDLLVLDGLIYWWHRANHEVGVLWRFHEVHHLDRFLDTSTALRFHFGEVALSAVARAAVVVLLDFPLSSILIFETLVLLAAIFHHSNLRLPPALEAGLAWIIVTPSIHWVHHHRVRADTDSNYATVLSLWDRLFGSHSPTRRQLDMAIGVERREERALAGLLAAPFRARSAASSAP